MLNLRFLLDLTEVEYAESIQNVVDDFICCEVERMDWKDERILMGLCFLYR